MYCHLHHVDTFLCHIRVHCPHIAFIETIEVSIVNNILYNCFQITSSRNTEALPHNMASNTIIGLKRVNIYLHYLLCMASVICELHSSTLLGWEGEEGRLQTCCHRWQAARHSPTIVSYCQEPYIYCHHGILVSTSCNLAGVFSI